MKRVTFQNIRNKTLIGNLYAVEGTSIIVMAHGFLSDKSSRGRFVQFAEAFNEAGFSALAFDFSGCGESEDDALTAAKQVEDLHAAIKFVKELGYRRIALYGHSLGSYICLRAYKPGIVAIVLSGALTGAMNYNWSEFFSAEELQELAETGFITRTREDALRPTIVLEEQMLRDFAVIDQRQLLEHVACPVLILHGNHLDDTEELQLLENSKRGMQYLSPDSQLEVIEGATHSFMEHLPIIQEKAIAWYKTYL